MQSTPSSVRSTLTPTVPPGGLGPLIPKLGGGRHTALVTTALAAFFLAGLADWLILWENTGLSLTLLIAAVAIAVITFGRRDWPVLSCAALAPAFLLIEVTALSVTLAFFALALAAMLAAARGPRTAAGVMPALARFVAWTPFRLMTDVWRGARIARRRPVAIKLNAAIWVMPIVCGLVFVSLFAEANPIFADLLSYLDPFAWLTEDGFLRLMFWAFAIAAIWPFLRPARIGRNRILVLRAPKTESVMFGEAAILRSLLIFNALFALQTALDLVYLTGGAALPEGMTYANYAHRGAYPLVATAMLAAGFVLAALRDGSASAANPLIRRLVYLWVAQNVALTATAAFRNVLYVEAYGLTELRLAAFVWMGLVALGLMLIIARIAWRKSGAWLVGRNTVALAATLIAATTMNTSAFIADYNVSKWLGDTDRVTAIDTNYLMRLGPQAIPAVDRLLAAPANLSDDERGWLTDWRHACARTILARSEDWRAFTIREASLAQYLSTHDITHSGPAALPEL